MGQQPNYGHLLYISISSSSHSSYIFYAIISREFHLHSGKVIFLFNWTVKRYSYANPKWFLAWTRSNLTLGIFEASSRQQAPFLRLFFDSKVVDGHHLGVLIGCRCLQVISREEWAHVPLWNCIQMQEIEQSWPAGGTDEVYLEFFFVDHITTPIVRWTFFCCCNRDVGRFFKLN